MCLGSLLQEMRRAQLFDPRLVACGLRSPVIMNRNMATNAILSHAAEARAAGLVPLLRAAAEVEPDDRARKHMLEAGRKVLGDGC